VPNDLLKSREPFCPAADQADEEEWIIRPRPARTPSFCTFLDNPRALYIPVQFCPAADRADEEFDNYAGASRGAL
jgi:hypothetical protein